ncbi:MAG: lytic transglycosylase domain-containing protein [Solirubrobacterales bacterium]
MAAFIAAFSSLLLFGLILGNSPAKSASYGPAAPTTAVAAVPADSTDTAASVQTESAAEETTEPDATTPPKTVSPTTDTNIGGAAPEDSPASGNDQESKNDNDPAREPAFVEQDPDLDNGGASPDDVDADDPFVLDRLNVPNFVIDNFEIPPFLLPIYQACGSEYGVPWEVLAAINRIETNFGSNVGTSTAGAYGWMQFIHSSWVEWGVDANGDKLKDPYNPVDAICAAANYLDDFGYAEDPYDAIFAYNHADWYVQDILEHAKAYAAIPPEVITSLTGLTEGARFPIASDSASYEGEISTEEARKNGTASQDVASSANRTSVSISAEAGAAVIAVNDGEVSSIDSETGTVVLEDVYGNRYSYAGLGSVAQVHPVPIRKNDDESGEAAAIGESEDAAAPDQELEMGGIKATDEPDPETVDTKAQAKDEASADDSDISEVLVDPDAAAQAAADQAAGTDSSADTGSDDPIDVAADRRAEQDDLTAQTQTNEEVLNTEDMRGRTYASPLRPSNQSRATIQGQSTKVVTPAGSIEGVDGKPGDYLIYDGSKAGVYRFKPGQAELLPLKKGSRVIAGTVLGRLADTSSSSINFSIKPGGDDAPQIDPKPFLDGWKLLAETNIYNAQGKDRFADRLGIGGVLLLSKAALQKRVLADDKLHIGECDRQYIAHGVIDRRLLAALSFITEKGYDLLITSLFCGREVSITTSGNISNHSRAMAVDIAAINGEIVTPGTQGPGSQTDQVAQLLLSLQGIMAPDEVITLMSYPQPAGFAMGDHGDHLHLGYSPTSDSDVPGGSVQSTLGAEQWQRLTERLGQIRNPEVPTTPSDDALPAEKSDKDK